MKNRVIDRANEEAFRRLCAAEPVLVDVLSARYTVPACGQTSARHPRSPRVRSENHGVTRHWSVETGYVPMAEALRDSAGAELRVYKIAEVPVK